MADSIDLHVALIRAARQCGIAPEHRLSVMQVADLVSQDPALAAAWARVLTEHTAPATGTDPADQTITMPGRYGTRVDEAVIRRVQQVYAEVEPHPFEHGPAGLCEHLWPKLNGRCMVGADRPVHRVESLSTSEADLLAALADPATVWPATGPDLADFRHLSELGFLSGQMENPHRVTRRGRAWLEAHPREGGEPS